MTSIIWKLNRLRVMGLPEMAYRFGRMVRARLEKTGLGLAEPKRASSARGASWCGVMPRDFELSVYCEAADRILAGRFDIFAMRGADIGWPPEWNRDPKTGTMAPLVFGKTLNYRDERIVGDIKYLWEPNRHLELTMLAQAYHLSGDVRYANGVRRLLHSWFEQCPYPMGANWVSSLESAIRLLNWAFAWHLLGGDDSILFVGDDGAEFKRRWLDSIYRHCHFIAAHHSRFSSANNHLLGEYMGLFVAAITWPCWEESPGWRVSSMRGLEREALLQNAADGVNREQALWYHHEVADMMLICGLYGRANGMAFSAAYWERLQAMLEFIASVMDAGGNMPMFGDADDAVMVRLSREENFNVFRSLLATAAVLFKRGDFKIKAGVFDDKSRWLLGDDAAGQFTALAVPSVETPQRMFREGGYYLLGTRFGEPDEVRAVVDCAPLGYLSLAAHGHADALSFTLSAGGRELLIDTGTYAYHTQKKWRNYFRGTFAHNTVRVDRVDQSVIGGNFLWLKKANAYCQTASLDGLRQQFCGWHDGYRRLRDPVIHRREVLFLAERNEFEVIDVLECRDPHHVEVCWHFAEACDVRREGDTLFAASGPVRLRMAVKNSALEVELLKAKDEPPAGWLSRELDVKVPTTTAVWRGEIGGAAIIVTTIRLEFIKT